jgi:hypothetical protein
MATCTAGTLCFGQSPTCPTGEAATGGGVETFAHRGANIVESTYNYGTHEQWFGEIDNVSATDASWEVDVVCAPTSSILMASALAPVHSQR